MADRSLSQSLIAAAVALAGLGLSALPAFAVTVTVGGRAQQCSEAAKAGLATPEAFEACLDAIYTEPLNQHDLYGTYVNRGTLYLVRGDSRAALKDFDIAKAGAPMLGEGFVNRGVALINLGRAQEAEPEITKGIEMGTEEPEKAYYNRALARWWLEDVKGAYADLKKAQALKPDGPVPGQVLANFTVTPVAR
jgi:tetratricopeptide (TPR) repeat protein